jgi:hypothetical protein
MSDGHQDISPSPESHQEQDQRSRASRAAVEACDRYVDDYRSGKISKISAIRQIDAVLAESFGTDNSHHDSASSVYLEILDNHDFQTSEASKRGERRRSLSTDGQEDPAEPLKRRQRLNADSQSESTRTLEVDESQTPWGISESFSATKLSSSLRKTNDLIKQFSGNPKGYKRSLTNSTNCPEFPDSEWPNVLAGRAVNLDIVFSGYYSTSNNDKRIETVGELEIRFGTTPAKRVVASVGDWTIAWGIASTAIAYAFPNRFDELTSYGRFVLSLFASTSSIFHQRVISFDKAVRRRVGATRRLELTDYQSFADLKASHLESTGAAVGFSASQQSTTQRKSTLSSTKPSRKDEACNKWNDNACTLSATACKRSHICNVCKKAGHKGKDCKDLPL